MTTVFVAQFADEGLYVASTVGDDHSIVIVPGLEVAKRVNEALPGLDGLVAIINGAIVTGDWLDEMGAPSGAAVLSPYVAHGGDVHPWYSHISPYAFVMDVAKLRQVGGLCEEVSFGFERLLAARLPGWTEHTPFATATPLQSVERDAVLADLYYLQLEDLQTVNNLLHV